MKEKRFFDRVLLLNAGRVHYLEFLRNLGSHVLLFTVFIIVLPSFLFVRGEVWSQGVALQKFFWHNEAIYYATYLGVTLFIFLSIGLAVYSNISIFLSRVHPRFCVRYRRARRILHSRSWLGFFGRFMRVCLFRRPFETIEFNITIYLCSTLYTAALLISVFSVISLFKA